jgi:aminoglycoside phosphotransferase
VPTQLSLEHAQQLLARIGPVEIDHLSVAATTNDVFRVVTRAHGTFFIKFHTARWYADQPDTAFVAEREAAAVELLRTRDMPLPYVAWADTSRSIVSRSVFICGELPGIPVPEAAQQYPAEANEMLRALGRYLRRLHATEFANPGILSREHAALAPPSGVIPYVASWDEHAMHHPEHFQREALAELARTEPLLPREAGAELAARFAQSAEVLRPNYHPPRFVVGNCHAYHFHVARDNGAWDVTGLYDFEAVSAGDCATDLVELEVTLTPALRSHAWREALFAGYGRRPDFAGYRLRLWYYLLCELGRAWSTSVPDPEWLSRQWPALLAANTWDDLVWFPEKPAADHVKEHL